MSDAHDVHGGSSPGGMYGWSATASPTEVPAQFLPLGGDHDRYATDRAHHGTMAPSRPGRHSRSSSTATTATLPHTAEYATAGAPGSGMYPLSAPSSRSSSFTWSNMYPGASFSALASAAASGQPLDRSSPPILLAGWDQPPQPQPHPASGSAAALRGSRRASDASSMLDSATHTPLSTTAIDLLRNPRPDAHDSDQWPGGHPPLSHNSSGASIGLPPWTSGGSGGHSSASHLRALAPFTSTQASAPMSAGEASGSGPTSPSAHKSSFPSTLQHHWNHFTGRRRHPTAAAANAVNAPPASGLTPTTGSPPSVSQSATNCSPRAATVSLPTMAHPSATGNGPEPAVPPKDRVSEVKATQRQSSSSPSPSSPAITTTSSSVYPALVSHVAKAFQERVPVSERNKDGLRYKDAFEGRTAVDKLCQIIRTSDRNLALLVGRALDAQKFFHDVTYHHRLRDSTSELYQFRVRITAAPGAWQGDGTTTSALEPSTTTPNPPEQEDDVPTGVFTLLTECYSPTCSPDRLCYSITCPRRLEQQARMHRRTSRSSNTAPVPVRTALGLVPADGGRRGLPPLPGQLTTSTPGAGNLDGKSSQIASAEVDHQYSDDEDEDPGALWAEFVPSDVLKSVPERERKRQELINEVVVTERNFVRDMEYLRNEWLIPLRTRPDVIPESRRDDFVLQVFWNITEILGVHQKFCEALVQRTKRSHVVERIADVFLKWVPSFEPFVRYGAHQLYGKYHFEQEKLTNSAFAKFVEETERRPAARKLELNGYLTKPVTRLARYPLLLHQVLKYTPANHPDAQELTQVIDMIKQLLTRVNLETGLSANRFNLAQLDQQLTFKPGEAVDLRLRDPMRELVFRGFLKRRNFGPSSESWTELQVFLFDHALLLTKPKMANKQEVYRVWHKPVPLELLVVTIYEELPSTGKTNQTRVRTTTSRLSTGQRLDTVMLAGAPKQDAKQGYALTLTYLGRKGYTITLWASTFMARQKWFEQIEHQQKLLRARSNIFNVVTLHTPPPAPQPTFPVTPTPSQPTDLAAAKAPAPLQPTCAVPFDFGRRIILGAQDGVYLTEFRQGARPPTKVLPLTNVTQIDVLEEFQILIVLADRTLHTFMLDALDPHDPVASLKRGRRIQGLVTFFRAGVCLNRTLVCLVKSSNLPSSTIRTLEPVDVHRRSSHHHAAPIASSANTSGDASESLKSAPAQGSSSSHSRTKKRTGSQLHKLFPGNPSHNSASTGLGAPFGNKQSEALRVFKEFYIPMESTSVHFLKSKLCIAATKGFEIVDLETLDTQALLDPADPSLDFVLRNQTLKPIAIYRIQKEFLLCYDEFALYVNKTGWRTRGNWIVHWEGHPTAFALHYPYILAFEKSFIEVRHVNSGALHQVITGTEIKCLFSDVPPPLPPAQQAVLRQLNTQFNSFQLQEHTPPGYPSVSGSSTPLGARTNIPLPPTHSGSASARSPPLPPTPIPLSPMWESAHASRTPIVFGAADSMYYVRRANAK